MNTLHPTPLKVAVVVALLVAGALLWRVEVLLLFAFWPQPYQRRRAPTISWR